ncbi:hypothetical protein HU745_07300 [Pseudomonas mosselii]|uniref:hypothetical protein n=1 Tax=Pseudomonas mosselii TaxID=78327 RepID=UPI0016443802|nr:hypothetical protein [Pseudomonas mosselii]MBC3450858.1 hypothetical protein [Pseudomonas mosselii]
MSVYSLNASGSQFSVGKALAGTYSSGYVHPGAGAGKYTVRNVLGEIWAWTLARRETNVSSAQIVPQALLEYAYMLRLEAIKAEPSLERYLTTEHAAKAAYLEVARESLSARANARLCRLAQSSENWDGEGARAMSISALSHFVGFLSRKPKVAKEVDIFLGFYGEIVASWILADGSTLDISFGDKQIELATDQHDEVFSVGDTRLFKLIAGL